MRVKWDMYRLEKERLLKGLQRQKDVNKMAGTMLRTMLLAKVYKKIKTVCEGRIERKILEMKTTFLI